MADGGRGDQDVRLLLLMLVLLLLLVLQDLLLLLQDSVARLLLTWEGDLRDDLTCGQRLLQLQVLLQMLAMAVVVVVPLVPLLGVVTASTSSSRGAVARDCGDDGLRQV